MFDSIIQAIKDLWADYLQFYVYVPQFRAGIVLRNGTFHRLIGPGWHWKWPTFEEDYQALVIPTTYDLKPQSLVTKDGKSVVVRGMIKSKTEDTKKFLLESYDQVDALGDTTMGVIARLVMDSTYQELMSSDYDINNKITIKARVAAKAYGIYVLQVTLIEITPARSLRIFNDKVAEEVKS